MVGAAGLAHGYAYGEAVIGAEATPLVAYLAGLALVQMALLVLVFKTVRALLLIAPLRWQGVFRALGVLVAFVAVWSGAGLLP
jgi:urease accessory protein